MLSCLQLKVPVSYPKPFCLKTNQNKQGLPWPSLTLRFDSFASWDVARRVSHCRVRTSGVRLPSCEHWEASLSEPQFSHP